MTGGKPRKRIRIGRDGGARRSVPRPDVGLELEGAAAIAELEVARGLAEPMPHDLARGLMIRTAGRAAAGVQLSTCPHIAVPPQEVAYLDALDETLRCAGCRPTEPRDRCDQCGSTVAVRRTIAGLPEMVATAWLCTSCRTRGGDAA